MSLARVSPIRYFIVASVLAIVSCGGGGGGGSGGGGTITSFELLDPTPGANNEFGYGGLILSNGNIVVSDPGDSSVAALSGAVHLFNPLTQTIIASIYGDTASEALGIGLVALANNNFVVASPAADVGGVVDAGSVRLFNGTTGAQIGSTIVGNSTGDALGDGIATLSNGNYVIVSRLDDIGGIVDTGSVRLMNGATGAQIGSTIVGDSANDFLGVSGITELANNNFVIGSSRDDVGGIMDAGSVMLVNGLTGAQIGSTIAGDSPNDWLGSAGVTALTNNNFVIASRNDDVGGIADAGSVILVNGTTGAQIGSTIAGDTTDDLSDLEITALGNSNFVVTSEFDDEGGLVDVGTVKLVNGATGVQIGSTIAGDQSTDRLGYAGTTALANNNFVIASNRDDVGGIIDSGSVRLVSGTTGAQIGSTLAGDTANDFLGQSSVTALPNNNFVIATAGDNEGGITQAGSVRLVNGATGDQIGSAITGDQIADRLGYTGITALANNNYVIVSHTDDVGGITNAGSVMLVNGSTGTQIGNTIAGDNENDIFGFHGNFFGSRITTTLANNNFVIISEQDDVGGIVNAGSVNVVNGATGIQIGSTISGNVTDDMDDAAVTGSTNGDYYILSLKKADNNGMVDSGLVRQIFQ